MGKVVSVDRQSAHNAIFLGADDKSYDDIRRYYEVGSALIVCRNGLDINQLIGYFVDVAVGWDTVRPGFSSNENLIGVKRTKVTIFRVVKKQKGWVPLKNLLKNS